MAENTIIFKCSSTDYKKQHLTSLFIISNNLLKMRTNQVFVGNGPDEVYINRISLAGTKAAYEDEPYFALL